MSASVLIIGAVFIGVATLILFVAMALRDKSISQIEGRLNTLTGKGKGDMSSLSELSHQVAKDMNAKGAIEQFVSKYLNLSLMFEQAKVDMSVITFLSICLGLGFGSTFLCGIAGISLIVGGIGIMNIMLVTVTERTREIGIRKALGATRLNILMQFLVEATILCMIGGSVGILLGTGIASLMTKFVGWQTIVSPTAIGVAFLFSAAIGMFFGILPALKAARLDPIEALRYE